MATTNNIFYLGQDGAEQLVANVKNLIGDYALKDETEAALGETVKFTAQSLTDEQKAQARENIGIVEGVSSWNDLTDKPFYVQSNDTVLLDGEFTTEYIDAYGVFGIDTAYNEELEAAPEKVTMVYDGVEYKDITFTDIPDLGKVGGNLYHMNALFGTSYENTGEPFILAVTKYGCAIMTLDTAETAHVVRVSIPGEGDPTEKINPSCLPEGYPYSETVILDPTFDGDITGRKTVLMQEGTYAVKVSTQYAPVEEMIGATMVLNIGGAEQTVSLTAENTIDATNVLGVPGAVVVMEGEPIVLSLPTDTEIMGMTLSAGTWFMCVPGAFYVKSISCLAPVEQKVIHKIDMKYMPEGYPYVDTTMVYHPFDGDIAGKEAIMFKEGAYAVRVSTTYVSASEANGGTLVAYADGQEVTVPLYGSDGFPVYDTMDILGIPGMIISLTNDMPLVLSLPTDTEIMGVTLAQGTWFMCMPGVLYIKSLSCLPEGSGEVEVVHKIDPKYLPDMLPEVDSSNEGAFLRVVNGSWAIATLANVEDGEF